MKTGVYHLFKNNSIVYIGFTTNLERRLRSHGKKFDKYEFFEMDKASALKKEKLDIIKYKPALL